MSKSKRNHMPCRVCGGNHKNPASSSICPSCGEKERLKRLEAESLFKKSQEDQVAQQHTLFEAAPDMYRALRGLFELLSFDDNYMHLDEVKTAEAALAKADREQQ